MNTSKHESRKPGRILPTKRGNTADALNELAAQHRAAFHEAIIGISSWVRAMFSQDKPGFFAEFHRYLNEWEAEENGKKPIMGDNCMDSSDETMFTKKQTFDERIRDYLRSYAKTGQQRATFTVDGAWKTYIEQGPASADDFYAKCEAFWQINGAMTVKAALEMLDKRIAHVGTPSKVLAKLPK